MREAKFNFIPARQLVKKEIDLYASVNTRNGRVSFSKKHPESEGLVGKFVKTFVDQQKKVIGWQYVERGPMSVLENVKEIKRSPVGIIGFHDMDVVRALNLDDNKTIGNLVVRRYKPQGVLEHGEYFYITLSEGKIMSRKHAHDNA